MYTPYLVLCMLVCLLLWHLSVWWRHYNSVPSVAGCLPVIGHLHKLAVNYRRIMAFMIELSVTTNELGGISKIWLGPFPMYILTDPEDSLTVLNQAPIKNDLYELARPWVGQGLITATSVPKWKRNRRLLTPAFKPWVLSSYLPSFNHQARILIDALAGHAGQGFFDHWPHLSSAVLNTLFRSFAMPESDENTEALYFRTYNQISMSIVDRFKSVIFIDHRLFPFSAIKRRQDALLRLQADVAPKILEQAEKDIKEAASRPSGARLAKTVPRILAEAVAAGSLSRQEACDEINTFTVAGYDTSASTLCAVTYMLGLWPEVQERVYQEVRQVLGDGDVTVNNMDSLVYTEAVIKETLRIFTPVGGSMRNTDKDIELKSCTIPGGSYVAVSFLGLHRAAGWGDAAAYRPERWLDPARPPPPAFAAFSLGRRDCIGKRYALMLQKTMVAHMVRRLRLRSAGELLMEFHIINRLAKECTVAVELRTDH